MHTSYGLNNFMRNDMHLLIVIIPGRFAKNAFVDSASGLSCLFRWNSRLKFNFVNDMIAVLTTSCSFARCIKLIKIISL